MKKPWAALAAVLVLSLAITGCAGFNPGPEENRDYGLKDFSAVRVSSAFEMELVRSDAYAVTVTAQEGLFEHIKAEKTGDTLAIGMEWGWGTWVPSWGYHRPKVRITMPEVSSVDLSGASRGTVSGFRTTRDLQLTLSGASSLDADFESGDAVIEISGASHLSGRAKASAVRLEVNGASRAELAGSAGSLRINASGASQANMGDLAVGDASVELSGASRATISPTGKMQVKLSGASSLVYAGSPELDGIDISGASTIRRK